MLSVSGSPVVVGVTMYILSISSVSEVMMVEHSLICRNVQHCVPLFKTLVIILRLKTNPFDVFNNDLTSKHVFEQSSC